MVELKNKEMSEFLSLGLRAAYFSKPEDRVEEGNFRELHREVLDGKTFAVFWVNDYRINGGVPFVDVYMKYDLKPYTPWTFYLRKSLDFSVLDI